MQFFHDILQPSAEGARPERRGARRLSIHADFPLRTALSFIGRDEHGQPLGTKRAAWHWKGRLINCSERGARLQLAPSVRPVDDEECDLQLNLDGFALSVPGRITNLQEEADGVVCGLKLAPADEETAAGFRQFLEIVALGGALKPRPKAAPVAGSGYVAEHYTSDWQSRLSVWRYPKGGEIAAFEFVLKDCLVRWAHGQKIEYFNGAEAGITSALSFNRSWEIRRLFQWVVPNLAPAVADDVRAHLRAAAS
jgi:hypothetical protein